MLTRLLTLGWLMMSTSALAEPSATELDHWLDSVRQRAEALAAMDVPDFEAEMTERSAGLFGPLFMALDRPSRAREEETGVWPVRGPEAVVLNVIAVALFNYFV